MDRIFGELKLEKINEQSSAEWLSENVWHPFANGSGLIQIYDSFAKKPVALYKVPHEETFSGTWCLQSLSSAAGAIVPFVMAGKITGRAMGALSKGLALEGGAARIMASENLAQIAGAGIYTFAQKPAEGQTRLGNAAGSMVGFSVFSGLNGVLEKNAAMLSSPLAKLSSRFAVGALGGLSSYESANAVSGMQGVQHQESWRERMDAIAHGGFINVALPVVQRQSEKLLQKAVGNKMSANDGLEEQLIDRTAEHKPARDIEASTTAYERWMKERTKVVPEDLSKKHDEMSKDSFRFLRGTYYRWAESFPEQCPELQKSPKVNSIGDLHIDNFGTWLDKKGRLNWGVNDFDEAFPLPYTNDLVRLLTSANMLKAQGKLKIGLKDAAEQILDGYKQSLKDGGKGFVLSDGEGNGKLAKIAESQMPKADEFWLKLKRQISPRLESELPSDAARVLRSNLPSPELEAEFGQRQAGVGSLGRQRYVAIGEFQGGNVAAEAKALVPPANFFSSAKGPERSYYMDVMGNAVREIDPQLSVKDNWVVRSLGPKRSKIELSDLNEKDEGLLLWSMGYETGNIHLGTKGAADLILKDIKQRNGDWLSEAAKTMSKSVSNDYHDWKSK
ncbi:MAG: DUF2252 domain-containing protein [Candidatus Obscuribacterales bacterium]|nr:DUF2252 domain-containing protein [Candidatus Obscuribacterales bacterium]